MTFRELSPEELERLRDPLLVDVRSPCEHSAESVPGSINIPLLGDEERAAVGTVYKHEGEMIARRKALDIIAPKIPRIIDEILSLRRTGQPIVVHCWRGGLRSEAVASFLSVVGIDCWRLSGGYKAWRRHVLNDFQKGEYPFRAVVLHGLTGTGKTDVLKQLDRLGCKVLDLEHLANHRGSVFGGIGLSSQPTQKNFDALLWKELKRFGREFVFLEAESRKVGKISLPDFIVRKISEGKRILIKGSLASRCARIMADYAEGTPDEAIAILQHLKPRLGGKRLQEIETFLRSSEIADAVSALLTDYYDPLYQQDINSAAPFELEVCADDSAAAAREIHVWLGAQVL